MLSDFESQMKFRVYCSTLYGVLLPTIVNVEFDFMSMYYMLDGCGIVILDYGGYFSSREPYKFSAIEISVQIRYKLPNYIAANLLHPLHVFCVQ